MHQRTAKTIRATLDANETQTWPVATIKDKKTANIDQGMMNTEGLHHSKFGVQYSILRSYFGSLFYPCSIRGLSLVEASGCAVIYVAHFAHTA